MRTRSKLLALCGTLILAGLLSLSLRGIRYRLEVVGLKLVGDIPDVSWGEMTRMLGRDRALNLGALVESRNPYQSITNPFASPADVLSGGEMFRTQCVLCHAPGAGGEHAGPDLSGNGFKHGASDWALYRTIAHGVPGTAMPKHDLPASSVWQIVAFVRQSIIKADTLRADGHDDAHHGATERIFDLSFERLKDAARDSSEWLMYSGSYDGHRHSRLWQISRANAARLQLKWIFQFPDHEQMVETTPLVVDTTMFVSSPTGRVWALDARTGNRVWARGSTVPNDVMICCGRVNRGLAMLGNTLFLGTMDAHLLALDASNGRVRWDVVVADYRKGYSLTGAPLALRDRVIVGIAGGEFGARGFLDAYSTVDGRRLWRLNTVPGPGEPGHDTWAGDSWKTGGAPTWLTGTYDPESGLLYWGVGNPAPDFRGEERAGANLYSCSVIAVDAETGELRWYYQFNPHDEHDWDAVQVPVLADASYLGQPRKLIYLANRNGFYYVLDRTTGQFLHAAAFVKQTWSAGFDSTGRPLTRPEASPTLEGALVYPSVTGGTNWWSPSYDPATNLFYVAAMEGPSLFFKNKAVYHLPGLFLGSGGAGAPGQPRWTAIRALDASTGQLRWEHRLPLERTGSNMGGLLSTDGGLVFGGDQGRFVALDALTGEELWYSHTEGVINAAPITYLSQGRQQVTIAQGRALLTFSLDGH